MLKTIIQFLLLTIILVKFSGTICAQSITPQSVNSAGVKMTQSNGSVSFTLGELRVGNEKDSQGNSLGEGFTNASASSTNITAIKEPSKEQLNVSIYPNPSSDFVFVEIIESNLAFMYIQIIDQAGKLISSDQYSGVSAKLGLNVAELSPGIYSLNISDQDWQVIAIYNLLIK